jgi:hypothetical protein
MISDATLNPDDCSGWPFGSSPAIRIRVTRLREVCAAQSVGWDVDGMGTIVEVALWKRSR